ncbi:MAG: hypothetical protein EPN93_00555 [Spirochaetes bacterium]|nr:MAG: hypothetical protein EPN93_00555 [Spirochaetota bacterium]
MALISLNIAFNEFTGSLDGMVYYSRKGRQCVRRHVVPANPRTAAQQAGRSAFTERVHAWKSLPPEERAAWNTKAKRRRMTGYNLFMREGLKKASGSADYGA